MPNWTRKKLADAVARETGENSAHVRKIIDALFSCMEEIFVYDGTMTFRDFGVLEVVKRKQRIGQNPRNPGAARYIIPARREVRFRTSQKLLEKLNPETEP